MNVPLLVSACLAGWTVLAFVAAPYLGARLAGRHMTRPERDQLAWGLLAVFLVLFVTAALLIGTRP